MAYPLHYPPPNLLMSQRYSCPANSKIPEDFKNGGEGPGRYRQSTHRSKVAPNRPRAAWVTRNIEGPERPAPREQQDEIRLGESHPAFLSELEAFGPDRW